MKFYYTKFAHNKTRESLIEDLDKILEDLDDVESDITSLYKALFRIYQALAEEENIIFKKEEG